MSQKPVRRYCQFCQLHVADGDPEQIVYLGEPCHKHCFKLAEQQRRNDAAAAQERLERERRRLTPLVVITDLSSAYRFLDVNLYN